jgi:recombinase
VTRPPCCPEVAARIVSLRREGYSLQKIADLLNAEGVSTPMGLSPWKKSHVYELFGRLYVQELLGESDEEQSR